MICDQHGRVVRRAVGPDGQTVYFADSPPSASKEGDVVPRPQFATHAQVIAALAAERIDWLACRIRWKTGENTYHVRGGLTAEAANKMHLKLVQDGASGVQVQREIVSSGWPQLAYEELKKLPELPPTPLAELAKIRNPELRKAAMRARREADEVQSKQLEAERVEV
jgi:hypothetical protein